MGEIVVTYSNILTVTKPKCFLDYLNTQVPAAISWIYYQSPDVFDIHFFEGTAQDKIDAVGAAISGFVNPSVYYWFDHSDDHFVRSETTNAQSLTSVQCFIQSPNSDISFTGKGGEPCYIGDIKLLLEISTPDTSAFSTWDPEVDPISIDAELHCLSFDVSLGSNTLNVTSSVSDWKAQTPSGKGRAFKTLQVYGLTNIDIQCASVWDIRLSTTDPRASVGCIGVQRNYYQKE